MIELAVSHVRHLSSPIKRIEGKERRYVITRSGSLYVLDTSGEPKTIVERTGNTIYVNLSGNYLTLVSNKNMEKTAYMVSGEKVEYTRRIEAKARGFASAGDTLIYWVRSRESFLKDLLIVSKGGERLERVLPKIITVAPVDSTLYILDYAGTLTKMSASGFYLGTAYTRSFEFGLTDA